MKSRIIILMFIGLIFSGCTILSQNKTVKNTREDSFSTQINKKLNDNFTIEEITNPNLTLPSDININQIKKYFKLDDIFFALVLRNSMNIALSLPKNFTPTFSGILVAEQKDTQWSRLIEIKDTEETNKNNPYYLTITDKQLLLTVVDQNGAGSGEGIMKVFALSENNNWELEKCYYFGGNYNDPATDGDYFAFSVNFSKQTSQAIESCNNVQLISK